MSARAEKLLRLALDQAGAPEGTTALRLLAELCAREGIELHAGRPAREADARARRAEVEASALKCRVAALQGDLAAAKRKIAQLEDEVEANAQEGNAPAAPAIALKHAGTCAVCRSMIPAGRRAYWRKGDGVWHMRCAGPTWAPQGRLF